LPTAATRRQARKIPTPGIGVRSFTSSLSRWTSSSWSSISRRRASTASKTPSPRSSNLASEGSTTFTRNGFSIRVNSSKKATGKRARERFTIAHELDGRFFEVAEENRYGFMKDLYYHFVGDDEPKVKRKFLVRFYESITKYWITQINELLLFTSLVATFVFYFLYSGLGRPVEVLRVALIFIFSLLLLNRFFVVHERKAVRPKTGDEISDIHERLSDELRKRLIQIHRKFNLRYGSG
jgi:hypothetical protein